MLSSHNRTFHNHVFVSISSMIMHGPEARDSLTTIHQCVTLFLQNGCILQCNMLQCHMLSPTTGQVPLRMLAMIKTASLVSGWQLRNTPSRQAMTLLTAYMTPLCLVPIRMTSARASAKPSTVSQRTAAEP